MVAAPAGGRTAARPSTTRRGRWFTRVGSLEVLFLPVSPLGSRRGHPHPLVAFPRPPQHSHGAQHQPDGSDALASPVKSPLPPPPERPPPGR